MLNNLSDYELWTGDLDAARRHLAESLDIARALNARNSAVIGTESKIGAWPGTRQHPAEHQRSRVKTGTSGGGLLECDFLAG